MTQEVIDLNEDWTSNHDAPGIRPRRTWRCARCGAEFDYLTYGGPCPGKSLATPCGGELERRAVQKAVAG